MFNSADNKREATLVKKPMGLSVVMGVFASAIRTVIIIAQPQSKSLSRWNLDSPQPF
jgi:hypothetical protein